MDEIKQFQHQSQTQKQVQRLSQKQIQAVSFLAMKTSDLRDEIYRMASQNPAIEIVNENLGSSKEFEGEYSKSRGTQQTSDDFQRMLEDKADYAESLQQHLMEQLNLLKCSPDEYELCQKLIYNLDKDGFYGSMMTPSSLLDPTRPMQNQAMLKKCLNLIHNMDPVGTCCKDVWESLKVQAEINGNASEFTLFILDGHMDLLEGNSIERILKNIKAFHKEWHSLSFASEIPLDYIEVDEALIKETLSYIRSLNPYPASDYVSDTRGINLQLPDIVLTVEKKNGAYIGDDFSSGRIQNDENSYFQIKYATGGLPSLRLAPDMGKDKKQVEEAKNFIDSIKFRESSIVLQGCAIIKNQLEFFNKGPGHIQPLTRKQVSQMLGIHESTVSRLSSKKNGKYIQTEWGTFPASYFFSSGVKSADGEGVSSEAIKAEISKILSEGKEKSVSDSRLTELLNTQGIKIARRTVAKYRQQLGLENSYKR